MTSGDKGFTLVEVLVALVVLAVTAVALLQSFAGGLRASDGARQRAHAMLLAQSTLATVGVELALAPGIVNGRFDDRFAWQVAIAPEEEGGGGSDDGSAIKAMAVTVTISWPPGAPRGSIQLRSTRLARSGRTGAAR